VVYRQSIEKQGRYLFSLLIEIIACVLSKVWQVVQVSMLRAKLLQAISTFLTDHLSRKDRTGMNGGGNR